MDNIKNMFVRFCVASAEHVDLRLTIEQLICLLKECQEMLVGDKKTAMMVYFNLGMRYMQMEQYDDAVLYSKKCIDLAKKVGDKKNEMMAYLSLGETYLSMKQYDDALLYSKKCIDLTKETDDKHTEMDAFDVLLNAYISLEKYDDGFAYGKKNLHIAKETGNKKHEMLAHLLLGRLYLLSMQLSSCSFHGNEGLEIAEELKDNEAKDKFTELLYIFFGNVGMREEAETYDVPWINKLEDATTCSEKDLVDDLEQAKKTTYKDYRQIFPHLRLYCYYFSKHQYKQAIEILENLKELHNNDDELKLLCCEHIGDVYATIKKYKKALQYYEDGLTVVKECSNRKTYQSLKLFSRIGKIYFLDGQVNLAEQYLREAIQYFETVFASLGSHDIFKISIFDRYIDCYAILSLVLIGTKQIKEALLVSDRCRARALKDLLISNYGMKQEVSDEEHIQYSDIEALVSSNKFTILYYSVCFPYLLTFSVKHGHDLQFSLHPLEIVEQAYLQLIDKAFDEMKVRQVVNCEDRSLDTEQDIENSQKQDHNKEYPIPLASIDDLIQMVSSHQRHLRIDFRGETPGNDGESSGVKTALEILYLILIGKMKEFTTQEEIVILPDGPLYKVPFAALRDPETGRYLSETKRIRLAPSIATLKYLSDCPMAYHCSKSALIIGDPLVGKVMMNGEERDIPRLKGALEEAADIALILMVPPLLAQEATKPTVLKKLQKEVSVIHIAAHGDGSKACIALAPSPEIRATKIPDEEDYMLTMADVQKAQIRAQLVVLSCCQSGRGKIRAEGVVGMCRAFLASGARAVVASLWAINDQATLEFMKMFYKHLKKGNSASTSLHLTMNDMRQIPRYSEPNYWAPFFLMGDDVTIKF